jgi:hypothetical protein
VKWRALLDVPVLPLLLVGITVGLVGLTAVSEQPTAVGGSNLGSGQGAGLSQVPRPVKEFVPVRGPAGPVAPVRDQTMALRQLVIATGPDDIQLPTWKAVLDRIGTPYDVLYARTGAFTRNSLVRSDGAGRYNAVLLTSAALLVPDGNGTYASAFSPSDWAVLWDYERRYHVRQVSLNSGGGTYPEETCLREVSEGATSAGSAPIRLTTAAVAIFDYLRPDASLPLANSYVYRTALAPGCDVEPWLTFDGDVVGAVSTRDGRERAALTFSMAAGQPLEELLGYGLLRWATRGIFLGEQRHWLNVDVDDWFNSNTHVAPKVAQTDPDLDAKNAKVFRMTGPEALAISQAQQTLGARYPVAAGFMLNLAYNGGDINPQAPAQCSSQNTPDPLTSYSRCLMGQFRWINHTLTHAGLDATSYPQTYAEISQNLAAAAEIGLPVPLDVLKTPAYSGLGIKQRSSAEVSANGVAGDLRDSNPNLLKAAGKLGVTYLHGDLSFPGHRPDCFNCGKTFPTQPDLFLVPDWPTNIFWQAIDPVEETAGYNVIYGRGGSIGGPDGVNRTYEQIIDAEAGQTLQHIMQGSAYVHTLHQTNLHVYAPGHSLAFDWINAVVAKYSAYYRVPLANPDWDALAAYVRGRTRHFATIKHGPDALWNRVTNVITYTPTADSTLFVTGLATRRAGTTDQDGTDEADHYGTDSVSRVGAAAGTGISYIASPRP